MIVRHLTFFQCLRNLSVRCYVMECTYVVLFEYLGILRKQNLIFICNVEKSSIISLLHFYFYCFVISKIILTSKNWSTMVDEVNGRNVFLNIFWCHLLIKKWSIEIVDCFLFIYFRITEKLNQKLLNVILKFNDLSIINLKIHSNSYFFKNIFILRYL